MVKVLDILTLVEIGYDDLCSLLGEEQSCAASNSLSGLQYRRREASNVK